MCPDRDDDGQSTPVVTARDILHGLRDHSEPVATASDLAADLGVSAEPVRRHLSTLHDRGRVERKAVGPHATVWWITHHQGPNLNDDTDPVPDPFFDADPFPIEDPIDEAAIDDDVYGDVGG